MKRIFWVILFFVTLTATAQSNSFSASINKLVWENVFISNETNVQAFISRHSKLKIISADQNIIKGNAKGIRNTCPETSAFMKDNVSFDFEIELSDGKYRVTITNIIFTKKKATKGNTAENYFIKESQLQTTGTLQADLDCLDAYFNRVFVTTRYKNRS